MDSQEAKNFLIGEEGACVANKSEKQKGDDKREQEAGGQPRISGRRMQAMNAFEGVLRKIRPCKIDGKGNEAEYCGSVRIKSGHRPAVGAGNEIKGAEEYQEFNVYKKEDLFFAEMFIS